MTDYTQIKAKLEAMQTDLSNKLERIKNDVSSEHSSDWDEQAQERENDEVLDQLGNETQMELRAVNEALIRLKNNVYGKCTSCGVEIPIERLQVKPEASRCVKCAA